MSFQTCMTFSLLWDTREMFWRMVQTFCLYNKSQFGQNVSSYQKDIKVSYNNPKLDSLSDQIKSQSSHKYWVLINTNAAEINI